MKNKILAVLLVIAIVVSFSNTVFATTFNQAIGVPIHWSSTTVAYNQDYLDGIWANLGDDAASMWDSACRELTCSLVSFSYSKLDIITADNYEFDVGVVGVSNIYDSDGTNLNGDLISEFDSSGEISSAAIYMNPSPANTYTTTQKKGILGHEFGHCMGLWHPSSSTAVSIMQQGSTNTYWRTTPQTYDITDISSIY